MEAKAPKIRIVAMGLLNINDDNHNGDDRNADVDICDDNGA